MRPVLIVKTGTTVLAARRRGDFEQWIGAGMGVEPGSLVVRRVNRGEPLPRPDEVAGVVVTGSSAMVTDAEPWSERAARWLRDAVTHGTPVLGICYGHQLLAHALGGRVAYNPLGRRLGTVDVTLTGAAHADPLFDGLPEVVHVAVSHRQVVVEPPPGATLLATAAHDPHHAYRAGERAWGVQFHPEYDGDIVRAYLRERRGQLLSEGLDPDALARDARDTEHGRSVLRRFSAIVAGAEL
jgi:GMP synthase (glutamine-hydrolysing)